MNRQDEFALPQARPDTLRGPRRRPRRGLPRLLGLLAAGAASTLESQMVAPPETVWGDIDAQREGLQVGGVELLAGLLISLTLLLGLSAFLAFRRHAFSRRALPFEVDRLLAWCTFGVAPLFGLATILLAGPRSLFGIEVALLGVTLSLVTVLIGTASLVSARA